jgi:signal transduction histidine kinase
VTVGARAANQDGGQGVRIEVSDEGSGITPQDLPHIFDPFFTTKPPGQGTGLGLAMTRRFIDEHGGSIRAESKSNEGTTVMMWLPAAEAREKAS